MSCETSFGLYSYRQAFSTISVIAGARNDLPASAPEPLSHIGGPQRSLFASLPRAMLSTVYSPLARFVGGLVLTCPESQHENLANMKSVFCFAGKEMDK